jgi:hypothetical protein
LRRGRARRGGLRAPRRAVSPGARVNAAPRTSPTRGATRACVWARHAHQSDIRVPDGARGGGRRGRRQCDPPRDWCVHFLSRLYTAHSLAHSLTSLNWRSCGAGVCISPRRSEGVRRPLERGVRVIRTVPPAGSLSGAFSAVFVSPCMRPAGVNISRWLTNFRAGEGAAAARPRGAHSWCALS